MALPSEQVTVDIHGVTRCCVSLGGLTSLVPR
jgi:hypothetical protein